MRNRLRRSIIYFLIPTFLFFLGAFNLFNYLRDEEFGLLSLDVRGGLDQMTATRSGDLLAGDVVSGTFRSEFTNLGIISVRFFNKNRDSDDTLLFRLRELGSDKWYYQAEYKTDQFLPHKLFPFGFPTIQNSQDVVYEFQLESLRGATGSGIVVDGITPTFIAKSTYRKSELLYNSDALIYFVKNKFINIFGDPTILLNGVIYFLPLILYLFFSLSRGISFQFLTWMVPLIILLDIFWLEKIYGYLYFSLIFFWALCLRRFRFEAKISGLFATVLLVLTPVLSLTSPALYVEKNLIWVYLFLLVTFIQNVYEGKVKPKHLFNLKQFISRIASNIEIDRDSVVKKIPNQVLIILEVAAISIFVYVTLFKIVNPLKEFREYYPDSYMEKYWTNLIIPEAILVILLVTVFKLIRKKTMNLTITLIVLLTFFGIASKKIINKSLEFQFVPRVISVTPSVVSEAWTDIVVTGKNFRDIPFVGKIYINDVEQGQYLISWSDEQIVFRTNPDITKSGQIWVSPFGRASSNKVDFVYHFIE